ncbi:unnamed protein product [Effrenium voratum]|nr:unnamed protein product [Effrenium voratum]
MVRLAITADCWDSVKKVKRQLEDLSIPEPGSVRVTSDGKIFLETSMEVLAERVVCLSMVERVFLCLREEELSEEHQLFRDGPNYWLLQEWIRGVNWAAAFKVIDEMHGQRPRAWMLDSKRHGSRGSSMRAFDRLIMQQKVRDVLHQLLPEFGCDHHPYNADLMVYVFISATLGFVGVPLLHRRVKQGYFPHKGLHHSLCWGLAATAGLKAGEMVIDPMAGKGVVLLEAAAFWPACCYQGLELDVQQLVQAQANLCYAQERGVLPLGQSVGFVRADCRNLPLADGSVDVVLSDLPYGRQYGSEEENHALYAAALLEIARVLTVKGRAVLITSDTDSNNEAMAAATLRAQLHTVRRVGFRFGGNKDRVRCAMYCLVTQATASTAKTADLFDWSCIRRVEATPGFVWKAAKPLLQVYVPLKATGGQARERVLRQKDGGASKMQAFAHARPALECYALDELGIACSLYRIAGRRIPML